MVRFLLLLFFASFLTPSVAFAQTNISPEKPTYVKAKVLHIHKEGVKEIAQNKNIFQDVTVKILEGPEKNKEIRIEHGGTVTISSSQKLHTGETVILSQSKNQEGSTISQISDRYRLPSIAIIIACFFALVIFICGKKGVGAIIGLIMSLGVIVYFIIPLILSGHNPLFISIVGSLFILITTMFLAHGISQKTAVALSATAISLLLTAIFAIVFVSFARLSGLGSEDIYSLQQGFHNTINFQGLLLGGIIIGSLGVLDDVTTTQSATVFALAETDHKLRPMELFKKGMVVGREHITSVVNTLVLAYAGASIGVFIFFVITTNNDTEPLWVILNSEVLIEEVIRSLAGSFGLILAVPLTTLIAAFASRYSLSIK